MTRWLPIGLLGFALALIASDGDFTPIAGGREEDTVPRYGQFQTETIALTGSKDGNVAQRKADFEVKLGALVAEFLSNPKAAEKKYKGKVVEFTYPVHGVALTGGVQFMPLMKKAKDDPGTAVTVVCPLMPESYDAGMRCSQGQKVKVQTKITGWINDSKILTASETQLTPVDKSKLLVGNSVDFAADVDKDANAAGQKYLKDFLLTGVVENLTRNKFQNAIVTLKGSDKTRVNIIIFDEDRYKTLKKGQNLEIRCNGMNAPKDGVVEMSGALLKNK